MTNVVTINYVTLSEPSAMLTFDPVALFVPMSMNAWSKAQPSRRAWRDALGGPNRIHAEYVELTFTNDLVGLETDCIGCRVLTLSLPAIARMMLASGNMQKWNQALCSAKTENGRTAHMRKWLRTFLLPADAAIVEEHMKQSHRRATEHVERSQKCLHDT